MPSAISSDAHIRSNTPAENAYNALEASNRNIATRRLRMATGKRINSAAGDVAGHIISRNDALKAALHAVADVGNVADIAQEGLATDEKEMPARSASGRAQQTDAEPAVFGEAGGVNLSGLVSDSGSDRGIFSSANILTTLGSLSDAFENMAATVASQEDVIKSQMTNYNAAISPIEDAAVAKEQLELSKAQFLQQASLTSLSQANQSPQAFLQLLR